MNDMKPTATTSWNALKELAQRLQQTTIKELFEVRSLTTPIGELEYSYQRVNANVLALLERFCDEMRLQEAKQAMIEGSLLNNTEKRAVLHAALRSPFINPNIEGKDIQVQILDCQKRYEAFVESIHQRTDITDIIHIGIGGSDLGPRFVVDALSLEYPTLKRVHFLSNVDGHAVVKLMNTLSPQSTYVLIASKTFTTQETMLNANTIKAWLTKNHVDVADHMAALSTNTQAATAFGIRAEHVFEFWDWVGGRYSLWSSIGLPIALAYGNDIFTLLKKGAETCDTEFFEHDQHPATILALLGIWNSIFLDISNESVAVYDQRLTLFAPYLQQLRMESNGKSVDKQGDPVSYRTSPSLIPSIGTDSQHAFFQQFHQGTDTVALEFYAIKKPAHQLLQHHDVLLAHAQGQAEAFAFGDREQLDTHRMIPGNKPSTFWTLNTLDAFSLGYLIATQEHRTFVQGHLLNINSFDQFGVELGKKLANKRLNPRT